MKVIMFGIFLFLLAGCSHAPQTVGRGNEIVIGKIDSFYSKTLGEERKVWVHVPDGGPDRSKQRYPVVYLLDGDAHFPSVEGMIQQLSEVNGNTVVPDMILVGIPNTDRLRDLTPTRARTGYMPGDTSSVRNSCGGENFTTFIEKELIPHIDSLYPTAPYKMLIGHSLGGLMVINTLIHHTQLFNAYLAIDPSMWWDNQLLLHQTDSVLANVRFDGKALFLGVANTMPKGMDTMRVKKDTTAATRHIRSILHLAEALRRNGNNGLRFSYKYYDGDNHGSVPLISEYDAFRFIFNYYNFDDPQRLLDSSMTAAAAVEAVADHYRIISTQMGYSVLPPEEHINQLGYQFLQSGMLEKAGAFFKMNVDNYPKSGNVYDSMGDFYVAARDTANAIDYYNKALAINDNADTREKMAKLKK